MRARILRFCDGPAGVFGYLDLYDDAGVRVFRAATCEDDWLDNKPRVSCIPVGGYPCKRVVSPKFGDVFEITKVPGRSAILIHSGNTEEDVEGCVLLGTEFGAITRPDEDLPGQPVKAKWAVVQSKVALARFMSLLAGQTTFPLEIRWAKPGEWRP